MITMKLVIMILMFTLIMPIKYLMIVILLSLLLMTHKCRGSIVVLSISKSVEPNEEQKEMISGFQ